jgi:segregation and condensation protein B
MYATTRQFLDYFNLKSLDQLPALAEIRDLETLNAELGFSEPAPKRAGGDTPDSGEDGPELTVVGGTEHTPPLADAPAEAGVTLSEATDELESRAAAAQESMAAPEAAAPEPGSGEISVEDGAADDEFADVDPPKPESQA